MLFRSMNKWQEMIERKKQRDKSKVEERMIEVALNQSGFVYGEDYEVMGVPNITHITYGRDVGYKIEREYLDEETEDISATDLRNFG